MECDFHERYGLDLDEEMERPWCWTATRVYGLLQLPPVVSINSSGSQVIVQQSRLAHSLHPPEYVNPQQ